MASPLARERNKKVPLWVGKSRESGSATRRTVSMPIIWWTAQGIADAVMVSIPAHVRFGEDADPRHLLVNP
ncbi:MULTISPECIES: hypothetical protein [Marinobacter]|uniref:hypothetical protein n=1 Tax=Marinobacter TaxID=2742 RepID=UPI00117DF820|nr:MULTISPECIES: hypothetical protein [Marinobacter]